jgi:hypothetical protein
MFRLPKLVGLLGRSRVGKDTVADFIKETYPEVPFTKMRLATPIKEAVCALYGFTPEQVEGPMKESIVPSIGTSPRLAMVHLTQTMMELNGPRFFSDRLFRGLDHIAAISLTHVIPIIPDIRYAHDVEEIRRRGGIVIKLERSGATTHSWEQGIDDIQGDFTIINNGSREDLYEQVRRVFSQTV